MANIYCPFITATAVGYDLWPSVIIVEPGEMCLLNKFRIVLAVWLGTILSLILPLCSYIIPTNHVSPSVSSSILKGEFNANQWHITPSYACTFKHSSIHKICFRKYFLLLFDMIF